MGIGGGGEESGAVGWGVVWVWWTWAVGGVGEGIYFSLGFWRGEVGGGCEIEVDIKGREQ